MARRLSEILLSLPEFQGADETFLKTNLSDVISSGDANRISKMTSRLKSQPEYQDMDDAGIIKNVSDIISVQPHPSFFQKAVETGKTFLGLTPEQQAEPKPQIQPQLQPLTPETFKAQPEQPSSLEVAAKPVTEPKPAEPFMKLETVTPSSTATVKAETKKAEKELYPVLEEDLSGLGRLKVRGKELFQEGVASTKQYLSQTLYSADRLLKKAETEKRAFKTEGKPGTFTYLPQEAKPVEKMTEEEKKKFIEPTFLKRFAVALDKSIDPVLKEDMQKNNQLVNPLERPKEFINNAASMVASQIPLYAQQYGLNLIPGVGPAVSVGSMMMLEGGNFLQAADEIAKKIPENDIDTKAKWQEIVDKNAALYGTTSGTVEYMGNAFGLLKGVTKKAKEEATKTVLKDVLGWQGEGLEEAVQTGLMNVIMSKAVLDMRKIKPDFESQWQVSSALQSYLQGLIPAGALIGAKRAIQTQITKAEPEAKPVTPIAEQPQVTPQERPPEAQGTVIEKAPEQPGAPATLGAVVQPVTPAQASPEIAQTEIKTETVKQRAPDEIIKPEKAINAEIVVAATDREKQLLAEKKEYIVDDLFNEEGAQAYSIKAGEDATKKLDENNIPYSYGRFDIEGMNTTNTYYGSHTKADVAIRQVIGQNLIKDIINAGGIAYRGKKADEIRAVLPYHSKEEFIDLVETARTKGLEKAKELGIDKLTHQKYNIPNYGALDVTYGITEGVPGKYGEMDRNADEIEGIMKEIKLDNGRKNIRLSSEEVRNVQRGLVRETQPVTKSGTASSIGTLGKELPISTSKTSSTELSEQNIPATTPATGTTPTTLLEHINKTGIIYESLKPTIGKRDLKPFQPLFKRSKQGGKTVKQLFDTLPSEIATKYNIKSPDDLATAIVNEGYAKPKQATIEPKEERVVEPLPVAPKEIEAVKQEVPQKPTGNGPNGRPWILNEDETKWVEAPRRQGVSMQQRETKATVRDMLISGRFSEDKPTKILKASELPEKFTVGGDEFTTTKHTIKTGPRKGQEVVRVKDGVAEELDPDETVYIDQIEEKPKEPAKVETKQKQPESIEKAEKDIQKAIELQKQAPETSEFDSGIKTKADYQKYIDDIQRWIDKQKSSEEPSFLKSGESQTFTADEVTAEALNNLSPEARERVNIRVVRAYQSGKEGKWTLFKDKEDATFWLNPKTGEMNVYIKPTANKIDAVLHEILGHYGARNALESSPELFNVLKKTYENDKTSDFYEDIKSRWPELSDEKLFDEWLAERIRTRKKEDLSIRDKDIIQRITHMIKRWLQKIGVIGKEIDKTLEALLDRMATAMPYGKVAEGAFEMERFKADPFFSPTLRAVENLKQEKGTGDQMFAMIIKTPGVKEAEWKWMGLDEFLKGKPSVTKADIVDFVRQNQVEIEEVRKDSEGKSNDEENGTFGREAPKFSQYVLGGGKNYRELLLKMPEKTIDVSQMNWVLKDKNGKIWARSQKRNQENFDPQQLNTLYGIPLDAEAKWIKGEGYVKGWEKGKNFISSHWSEPNVFAHVRMNDRIGPNGEKVFFIEENQSDWAREAREKGIVSEERTAEYKKKMKEREKAIQKEILELPDETEIRKHLQRLLARAKYTGSETNYPSVLYKELEGSEYRDEIVRLRTELSEVKAKRLRLQDSLNVREAPQGVPAQPFLKNWLEVTLRRILRMAAEEGYDRVAWINGEQTADRYDLSKQVDSINWTKFDDGTVAIQAIKKDVPVIEKDVPLSELPGVIGKDVAEKINSSAKKSGTLQGVDLKIGGEWASNLYDKRVPDIMNKIGKKFGAKVEPINLGKYDANEDIDPYDTENFEVPENVQEMTQQSLPITESMRESVLYEGQPMFMKSEQSKQVDEKGKVIPFKSDAFVFDEELAKTPEGKAKIARQMFEWNEKQIQKKFKSTPKDKKDWIMSRFIQWEYPIAQELEKTPEGERALMHFQLARGASSEAKRQFVEVQRPVFGGLSKKNRDNLNMIIYANRVIEIEKLKEKQQLELFEDDKESIIKSSGGLDATYMREFLNDFKKTNPELYDKLTVRAQKYWDTMQDQIKQLYDEGLINDPLYNYLKDNHKYYSPRKFIQHIDPAYTSMGADGKKVNVPNSGIKALDEGSTDAMVMDTEFLLSNIMLRNQARIFKNKANKDLYEFAKDENNTLGLKVEEVEFDKEGKAIFGKEPTGYSRIISWEDGHPISMLLPDEIAAHWASNDPQINKDSLKIAKLLSGSQLVRLGATGVFAPEFAISNMFRDIAYTWLKQHKAWSPILPVAWAQMAKDFAEVSGDVFTKRGAVIDYIKQGGGMDFLTTQGFVSKGKFGEKLTKAQNLWDKTQEVLTWLQNTSELWTRIALRNRLIKNGMDAEKATWTARTNLDFAQGGSITKGADNFVPYLNASIQGTRGIFQAFKDNPKLATLKAAQLMLVAAILAMWRREKYPEIDDQISDREKVNRWIIPTGTWYNDAKTGEKIYHYIGIPKDQAQRVFSVIAEEAMLAVRNENPSWDRIKMAAVDFSPIDVGNFLPPTMSAFFAYVLNKDFYTKRDIWKGAKVSSEMEYYPNTPKLWVGVGEATGMSPEKLRVATSKVFPNNIYSQLLTTAIDKLVMTDDEQKVYNKELQKRTENIPFMRILIRNTRPSNVDYDKLYKNVLKYGIDIFNEKGEKYVESYLEKRVKEEEIKANDVKQKHNNELRFLILKEELGEKIQKVPSKEVIEYIEKLVVKEPQEADRIEARYNLWKKKKGNAVEAKQFFEEME